MIFFIGLLGVVEAKNLRYIYLDSPLYIGGAGFFHNFTIVLGCLEMYDLYDYVGLRIDFGKQGLYYDVDYGSNWWSYYFDVLDYPPRGGYKGKPRIKTFNDFEKGEIGNGAQFYMTRERAHTLISRYLSVKAEIIEEMQSFYDTYLQGFRVIGVHYRGTDKILEATAVSYERTIQVVCEHIESEQDKIFVATDEEPFLDAMKKAFPGKICHTSAQRIEGKPVHYASTKCFLKGKEALMDCLLLAKSDLLIRTNSNLSTVAAFFNPTVTVVNLNNLCDALYEGVSRKGQLNELNQRTP